MAMGSNENSFLEELMQVSSSDAGVLSQLVGEAVDPTVATPAQESVVPPSVANDSSPPPTPAGEASGTDVVVEPSAIQSAGEPEFPDGVDPAFLAALPEDLRREVIEDQRRRQSLQLSQARAAAAATGQVPAAVDAAEPVLEVAPEFLAALPPEIQEEVRYADVHEVDM